MVRHPFSSVLYIVDTQVWPDNNNMKKYLRLITAEELIIFPNRQGPAYIGVLKAEQFYV